MSIEEIKYCDSGYVAKVLKIAFFGPSGSGKSTCADIITDIFHELMPDNCGVVRANVAAPLHELQKIAYEKFNIPNLGQDGVLLQFLAKHFEPYLRYPFEKRLKEIRDNVWITCFLHSFVRNPLAVILNSDVRNNSYKILKENGFIFVKVVTDFKIIRDRLATRKDVTEADLSKDVEKTDMIVADHVIFNNSTLDKLKLDLKFLALRLSGMDYEDKQKVLVPRSEENT